MYASAPIHNVPWLPVCRTAARWTAVTLVVMWLALVAAEATTPDFQIARFGPGLWFQGAALAAVFVGYALSWRRELAGGLLSVFATIAFFAINAVTAGQLPNVAAAWFAVPGLLFIEAWRLQRRDERHVRT